jgi:hypothetical protein
VEVDLLGAEFEGVSKNESATWLFGAAGEGLLLWGFLRIFFWTLDLPLDTIARLESLVLHSQVRDVEICGCVEGFDG